MKQIIRIATDFTDTPGGALRTDGPYSGQEFREDLLMPALKSLSVVQVELDGTFGYPHAWLVEAFRGLGSYADNLFFISEEEPSLCDRIRAIMLEHNTPEAIALICECHDPAHTLQFQFNRQENEIWTEVYLRQHRSFFKRLRLAIKYLFRCRSIYGHWECFGMSRNSAVQLRKALDVYLKDTNPQPPPP